MNQEAVKRKEKIIKSMSGFERNEFPDSEKGQIAKDLWDNEIFAFGMEYGYLLCLKNILRGDFE